jgi:drug/metabolite transporter (DMT)-like permease
MSLKMKTKDVIFAGVIGQLGVSTYQWVLYEALQVSSAGTSATIINMAPVVSLAVAAVLFKEQIPWRRWLGVILALVGVLVLGASGSTTSNEGIPLLIAAAIGLGLYSVFLKPLVSNYSALAVTFHATWPGAVLFIWATPELLSQIPDATATAWLGVVGLVVVVSAGGYVSMANAVKLLGVSKAAIAYYLVPPVAILYTFLIFGDVPLPLEYLGVAIVIFGVGVALSGQKESAK